MRRLLLLFLAALTLASACSSGTAATSSAVEVDVARQVRAMPIPPFNVLHLHDVKCTVQRDRSLVLCAGVPVTKPGKRYPPTRALFRLPTGPGDGQMISAVCNQGHYGIQPAFNIYCAE